MTNEEISAYLNAKLQDADDPDLSGGKTIDNDTKTFLLKTVAKLKSSDTAAITERHLDSLWNMVTQLPKRTVKDDNLSSSFCSAIQNATEEELSTLMTQTNATGIKNIVNSINKRLSRGTMEKAADGMKSEEKAEKESKKEVKADEKATEERKDEGKEDADDNKNIFDPDSVDSMFSIDNTREADTVDTGKPTVIENPTDPDAVETSSTSEPSVPTEPENTNEVVSPQSTTIPTGPTETTKPEVPVKSGTETKPAATVTPTDTTIETVPEIPTPTTDNEDINDETEIDRTLVYDLIDQYAVKADQADEAKLYANYIFDNPDSDPKSYQALTNGPKALTLACIKGLLNQASKTLGYKDTSPKDPTKDVINFKSGIKTQTKDRGSVETALTMPDGFGLKKNAVVWNTPVITDFGFPFLNFSSDAMVSILKAPDDDSIKNSNLKKLFKEASKKYGGIWKAIYSAPLELLKQVASDIGEKCTPNYLKVNGDDLIDSDFGENVAVIPIKYYSIEPEYEPAMTVPRDFLTAFYDVIDYSSSSRKTYLKYANGVAADEFAEDIDENNGIPPFYILVPKTAKFSKCNIRSGSLLGSLMNLISGRKPCTLVKTLFMGKRGCLAIETDIADKLYSNI